MPEVEHTFSTSDAGKTVETAQCFPGPQGAKASQGAIESTAHSKNQPMLDDHDMVYHETDEFWARQIYFEDEPRWWQIPDPRSRRYR